ncbi:MAG: C-factor, partial [Alphaproteobacteria bacterium]
AAGAGLSARGGRIGDTPLGGWHAQRASKAALHPIGRTASVELKRTRPGAICVALHPGTVDTKLSAPFSKSGLNVRPPEEAAADLLRVIDGLTPAQTGCFFDYSGKPLPW